MASFLHDRDYGFWRDATPSDIDQLIAQGADPNEYDSSRGTVIGHFILYDNLKAVRYLIEKKGILPPLENNTSDDKYNQYGRYLLAECSRKGRFEMVKLLLSSGADRLFSSQSEKSYNHSSIIAAARGDLKNENPERVSDLLLEYEYPLIQIEPFIREEANPVLTKALERQKSNARAVAKWFDECTPYPKKEEFLMRISEEDDEPAIATIIRTGRENLMKAFQPLEKWTKQLNRADLREIFAAVSRTDFFAQRVAPLEEALVLERRKQQRIQEEKDSERSSSKSKSGEEKPVAVRLTLAQKRQALSEILKSIDDPRIKQEVDDSVRKRWGWIPRSKRKGSNR